MRQQRSSCGRMERNDRGSVLKGLSRQVAQGTVDQGGDLGRARSGGHRGTLDGSVDDTNRTLEAIATPFTV
ncbi:hypothetical protein GUJ93_ZPchr0008g12575 [Zizania palustris]|uniref:Uncharacterized protein n=1 Tax=Zizania palustris TaxID=103762 RepID=A0A8J5VHQ3_ZIZPA|nr:hypothetical protein GUJ93_ZPchr0008g12575 [Zizania palustris]